LHFKGEQFVCFNGMHVTWLEFFNEQPKEDGEEEEEEEL
jgi:hypothetical protein